MADEKKDSRPDPQKLLDRGKGGGPADKRGGNGPEGASGSSAGWPWGRS